MKKGQCTACGGKTIEEHMGRNCPIYFPYFPMYVSKGMSKTTIVCAVCGGEAEWLCDGCHELVCETCLDTSVPDTHTLDDHIFARDI